MKQAEVKFDHNNGKGYEAAEHYAEKLFANGFLYSYSDPEGGKVYYHPDLNIEVLVYVA